MGADVRNEQMNESGTPAGVKEAGLDVAPLCEAASILMNVGLHLLTLSGFDPLQVTQA